MLLTEEENEEYAANTIYRQKTRVKFEPKIGVCYMLLVDTRNKSCYYTDK